MTETNESYGCCERICRQAYRTTCLLSNCFLFVLIVQRVQMWYWCFIWVEKTAAIYTHLYTTLLSISPSFMMFQAIFGFRYSDLLCKCLKQWVWCNTHCFVTFEMIADTHQLDGNSFSFPLFSTSLSVSFSHYITVSVLVIYWTILVKDM